MAAPFIVVQLKFALPVPIERWQFEPRVKNDIAVQILERFSKKPHRGGGEVFEFNVELNSDAARLQAVDIRTAANFSEGSVIDNDYFYFNILARH